MILSMTRSNDNGDIGFMAESERINVALSRAKKGLIIFGNMSTFLHGRKGKTNWPNLFSLLKARNHLYEGLPVRCERHQERTSLLKEPGDFERFAPDGGCVENWYVENLYYILRKHVVCH